MDDKTYYIEEGGLKIPVKKIRERKAFGRVDFLMVVVGTTTSKWVDSKRVKEN